MEGTALGLAPRLMTPGGLLAGVVLGVAVLAVLGLALVLVGRHFRAGAGAGVGGDGAGRRLEGLAAATERLAASQADLAGRLGLLAETQARATEHLSARLQAQERQINQVLDAHLGAIGERVGEGLFQNASRTAEALSEVRERLATIDAAQQTLTELSGRMAGLHDILNNKQARGALGQVQMEDLVRDLLPPGSYRFQGRLSNGRIADCVLVLPNPPGVVCLDAKYPLEAYRALINAVTDSARDSARRAFAADMVRHVRDIGERYIIPGETADQALMFLPAESVYAEVHAHHGAVVAEAFRRRVWIVSPTTLMATLTTMRAIVKDARLSQTANQLRQEIQGMVGDVAKVVEQAERLGRHIDQAANDARQVRLVAERVMRRGVALDQGADGT